jgi:glucose/mannose transport system substrate-binding protein
VFESVALGVGGRSSTRRPSAAGPGHADRPDHAQGVRHPGKVKGYIDKDAAGRDWNLATAMVINGKAGMQFMGDWAKGEFTAAGKKPGKDYLCVAAPARQAFQHRLVCHVQAEGREGAEGQIDLAKPS